MTLEEQLINSETFTGEHHKARVNILYSGYWLGQRIAEILKPYDISLQQLDILRILERQNKAPLSTLEIREQMIIGNADASRLVDKLCAKQLIWKKPCPHDGRKVQVFIDQKGIALLTVLDKKISGLNEITNNLNQKEIKVLNQLLNKLRA